MIQQKVKPKASNSNYNALKSGHCNN